jgi:hypothetical protein
MGLHDIYLIYNSPLHLNGDRTTVIPFVLYDINVTKVQYSSYSLLKRYAVHNSTNNWQWQEYCMATVVDRDGVNAAVAVLSFSLLCSLLAERRTLVPKACGHLAGHFDGCP